jgi:hypothetical protein
MGTSGQYTETVAQAKTPRQRGTSRGTETNPAHMKVPC